MPVISLVVLLLLYSAGARRVSPWQATAFAMGWLALAVALLPPLDVWSDRYLVAHMAQHELLMAVAAPLIALGAPIPAMLWAFPTRMRKRGLELLRARPIASAWSTLTSPLAAFLLHFVALWVWHLPSMYDAALAHEPIHLLQHLSFFVTSALFWWGIAHNRYGRAGYGVAVFYVFATAIHGGVLGALLALSPRAWYTPYLVPHDGLLSPLEDQQLAGLLMWVPAGLVFVAGGLSLFAAWMREAERRSRRYPSAPLSKARALP